MLPIIFLLFIFISTTYIIKLEKNEKEKTFKLYKNTYYIMAILSVAICILEIGK